MKKLKKRQMNPVLCGTALALALSMGISNMAGAEEEAAKTGKPQNEAVQAENIPVVDVEVKDKKEKPQAKPPEEQPEGSAANGYRSRTVQAGPLGKTDLHAAPFSFQVASLDWMKNMQANSTGAALRYNPTINDGSGANAVGGGASFSIRGFSSSSGGSSSNSSVDGMRTYRNANPIEDKERIEVMNGAQGFLYGVSSPGGMLNYVLKRPTEQPLADITIGNYGGVQPYIHGDFGGPLDKDGKFAYRANLLYVYRGNSGVSDQNHGQSLYSGALDWHVNPSTLLQFDYSHFTSYIEHGDDIFTIGTGVTAIPQAPDATRNYMPAYSAAKDSYDRTGFRLTKKINDIFSLRSGYSYMDVLSFRHRASDAIINNQGDYNMTRNYYYMESITSQGYAYVDADFHTGSVAHKATFGFSEDYVVSKYAYPYISPGKVTFPGVFNIYRNAAFPTDVVNNTTITLGEPDKTTESLRLKSILLADQMALNERWSMLVGANYASICDRNWDYSTYTTNGKVTEKPQNEKSKMTPGVALMYKFNPSTNAYLSYVESLQAGPTAPTTAANANQVLDPYVAKQTELGVKTTVGGVDLAAALFRIEKANAYTNPVSNIYSEDGQEVHKGLEFTATGKLSKNWTLTGGFTVQSAKINKASDTRQLDKTPSGVPEKMARLYLEYAVPTVPGLFVGAGVSYTGSQWVDSSNYNTLSIPSVFLGDCGLRYQYKVHGNDVTLRLNVSNLANKNYWVTSGGGSLGLGRPRTVSFSAEMKL